MLLVVLGNVGLYQSHQYLFWDTLATYLRILGNFLSLAKVLHQDYKIAAGLLRR
jgi:hypothetical protein